MINPVITCFGPARARFTLTANHTLVATSAERFFKPWWNPTTLIAEHPDAATSMDQFFTPWSTKAPTDDAKPTAHLTAQVDRRLYQEISDTLLTAGTPPREGSYAGRRLLYATDLDGTVHAVAPDDAIAYQARESSITIIGRAWKPLALATCRVATDLVWGLMELQGYTLVRASSATFGPNALLTLGGPRWGTSMTALVLATHHGFGLQATDAVFARVEADGTITTRPRVNTLPLGLGLLDTLGWYDTVRDRHASGDTLHPRTYRQVTDALESGHRTRLLGRSGEELTVHLWPDQIWRWFGLVPTHAANAAALLFPATHPTAVPAFPGPPRTVNEGDVLLSAPDGDDPLGLRPQHPAARRTTAQRLVQALTALPHHTIDLTRSVSTAVRCLDELAGTF